MPKIHRISSFVLAAALALNSVAWADSSAQGAADSVRQSLIGRAQARFAAFSSTERARLAGLAAGVLDAAYDAVGSADDSAFERMKERLESRISGADLQAEAHRLALALPAGQGGADTEARLAADLQARSQRVLAKVGALSKERLLELIDSLRSELSDADQGEPSPQDKGSLARAAGVERAELLSPDSGPRAWDRVAEIPGNLILGGLFLSMTIGLAVPFLEPIFFAMIGAGVGVGMVISWLDKVLH